MIALSQAAWTALGAIFGPALVFITWLASRKSVTKTADTELMTAAVNASLSTTETMRLLLGPLEEEIAELRREVVLLRVHVTSLEGQIRELGHDPAPPPQIPPFGRTK